MSAQDEENLSAADFLREVKALLAKRKRRDACQVAGQAVVRYGDDPFLLSYFGYLDALVNGRYRNGIDACMRAITLLQKKALRGGDDDDESRLGLLYLNLGRAYLAAGKKKEAIETLNAGLKHARHDPELAAELEKLGTRRYIPVPFLKRANLINEIVGRLLRKKKAEQE